MDEFAISSCCCLFSIACLCVALYFAVCGKEG